MDLTVVLVGAESTGKTTLARNLADHYGVPWVVEYARDYLAKRGTNYVEQDLAQIARGQWRREQRIRRASRGLVIVDTDWLVVRVWSQVKYGRLSTALDQIVAKQLQAGASQCDAQRGYLVPTPDIPWAFDPLRENPDDRAQLHERYVDALNALQLPYATLSGTHTQRMADARRAISAWLTRA